MSEKEGTDFDREWLLLEVVKFCPIEELKAEKNYPLSFSMTATQKEQKKDSQLKKIEKITKRSDYIRAANSIFKKSSSLVVQFYNREDTSGPRYGITASKKIGNAIKRNKAKRRIRHLIKNLLPKYGKNGYDYVFVAKDKVIESPWDSLLQETETILKDFKYE